VLNVGGTNTLAGTLSLTSGGSFWTFEAAAGKLRVTGTATNVTTTNVRTLWLRGAAAGDWLGVISDSAGGFGTAVRKDDAGAWTLSGNNAYTGPTVVSNGTLLVNGAVRGGAVSVYGGTLGGTGVLTALVTIYPGSTFAPGGLPGILTVSNQLILSDGSTTRMTANALAQTSDLVRGISNVAYAGTLSVSNLAGTPAVGQSFQLFSAASSAGNFAGIAPATPGAGLVWSFNPTNGTLFARASARPVVTRLDLDTNDSLIMSGTGPTDQPYRVLATTNLMLPLGDWTTLGTGTFAGGVFDFADPQATNNLRRFYRVVVP
jgi:autotransporter-associated beta strand protein